MKRKGDLTTLLKEDRRGLLPGKISILIILFPLLNLFPQKVINNFGISEFFRTYPSYTKFDFVDFNEDGVQDLFLYGNQRKNFTFHEGMGEHQYTSPTTKFFFFPIDDFGWLTKSDRGDDYYVFVSRNRRLAGLVSFTKSYSLQLLNVFNFDSYPSSLKIIDLNGDGSNEALIYGNNFDGVLLLRNEGYRLVADTLYKQRIFSDVEVIDFSQDEVDDLIVIDALYNSVNFLENTEIGGFFSTRIIEFEETLYSSQLLDINNDSFSDLVLAKENGFKIFFGDSVYSFTESFSTEFSFTPSEFLISDINSDGTKDLISINYLNNTTNVDLNMLGDTENIEFKFPGISDLKLFPQSDTAVYLLSKKGKIQIISDQPKWGSDFNLSIGGMPDKFVKVNSYEAKDSLIIISHKEDNFISSIKIDEKGMFSTVENIPFVNGFSDYISKSDLSKIAGYSVNNRLIEIITKNSETNKYDPSRYLYTRFPINSILLDQKHNFEIMQYSQDTLFHGTIEIQGAEYDTEKPERIDSNVFASMNNSNGKIYYWNSDTNNIYLKEYTNEVSNILLKIARKDSTLPRAELIWDRNPISRKIFTTLYFNGEESNYIVEKEMVHKLESKIGLFHSGKNIFTNMKYYSNFAGNNHLIIHRADLKKMEMYIIDDYLQKITFSKSIDGVELYDYFLREYLSHKYLIFTNVENNCISFRMFDQ